MHVRNFRNVRYENSSQHRIFHRKEKSLSLIGCNGEDFSKRLFLSRTLPFFARTVYRSLRVLPVCHRGRTVLSQPKRPCACVKTRDRMNCQRNCSANKIPTFQPVSGGVDYPREQLIRCTFRRGAKLVANTITLRASE